MTAPDARAGGGCGQVIDVAAWSDGDAVPPTAGLCDSPATHRTHTGAAPDARQSDDLRGLIAEALTADGYRSATHSGILAAVFPAVTAWHEKAAEAQARARAAEELEGWARSLRRVGQFGTRRDSRRIFPQVADLLEAGARDLRTDHWADRADALTGDGIDWAEVAAALAADDRTDPA